MIELGTIDEQSFGKRHFKNILETENVRGGCEETKCKQNTLKCDPFFLFNTIIDVRCT